MSTALLRLAALVLAGGGALFWTAATAAILAGHYWMAFRLAMLAALLTGVAYIAWDMSRGGSGEAAG